MPTAPEGNPLADRNPYVGAQAVGEGVFARLLAAIDNFTAVPNTFLDGGDHVVVLGRYGGTMKDDGVTRVRPPGSDDAWRWSWTACIQDGKLPHPYY